MKLSRTDLGPPDYREMLPPVIKENYGQWAYHEYIRPGVIKHVSEKGAELFTVRAGSPIGERRLYPDICDGR